MKSYEEITLDLLQRRDQFIEERNCKRKHMVRGVAVALCCVGIIVLCGIFLWENISGISPNYPNSQPDSMEQSGATHQTGIPTDGPESAFRPDLPVVWGDADGGAEDAAFISLCGKRLTVDLYDAIMDDQNSGKYLAISVRFAIDDQFVYQGKSLAEYELEQENHRLLNEKLTLLYKIGDVLKYGEKLYTEGTPDGEKWDQALYEKTLAFLGAEWVSSYIADGVFLREYVASDIKQWEKDAQAVDAARKEAYDAYFRHKIQETAENFVKKYSL